MRRMILALTAVGLLQTSALAGNAGVLTINSSTTYPFLIFSEWQDPGVTYTFTTSNLTPGSDTVINIQDGSNVGGDFIAGNDDYNGTLASSVTVPPPSTGRLITVIVHAYGGNQGTCSITVTSTGGVNFTWDNMAFGGYRVPIGTVQATAHVGTVEIQGDTSDTVVLLTGGLDAAGTSFDDDDGVGLMSWMHLDTWCPNCVAFVGSYASVGVNTTLVWDEDADQTDYDGDGLGASLEAVIGTDPYSSDTDKDGIMDGDELMGRNENLTPNGRPIKFPYMGANPLQQDLFAELDWEECTGPTCFGNLDLGQLGSVRAGGDPIAQTEAIVNKIESDLAPVHVHLDIGRTNTNPSTWTNWGDWGGAFRGEYTGGTNNAASIAGCDGASAERPFFFHFGVVFAPWTGHTSFLPGSCVVISNNSGLDTSNPARSFSHETGHSLALTHGGRPFVNSVNYKPQYESLMNYQYQGSAPAFSNGTSPVPQLNPMAMDESLGVGSADALVLNTVQASLCAQGGCVNMATGAVDWNRDGIFAPSGTTVQAPASLGDYSLYGTSVLGSPNDAAMSWVNAGSTFGDELWIFGRHNINGTLQYFNVTKTVLNGGCGTLQNLNSDGPSFNCAGLGGASSLDGVTLASGPGVAELGAQQMLLVYQPTSGVLSSRIVTVSSTTGQPTFGAAVALPGSFSTGGDVTALSYGGGKVVAWAQVGSNLKQWVYRSGAWQSPTDMRWSEDSTFVVPQTGIGATLGYLPDYGSAPFTVMAIPTAPNGTVEFAIMEQGGPTSGMMTRWTPSWSLLGAQPMATGRPGLAFQHQQGQAANVGRFYMAFTQTTCSGPYGDSSRSTCAPIIMETEGNLGGASATNRRLKWVQPGVFSDPGAPAEGQFVRGMVLVDDATRDTNLRGLANHINGNGTFSPLADGIFNATLSDLNDYAYITGALRASLGLDGGNWPAGVLPSSLP